MKNFKRNSILAASIITAVSVFSAPAFASTVSINSNGISIKTPKSSVNIGNSSHGSGVSVNTPKSSVKVSSDKHSSGVSIKTPKSSVTVGSDENGSGVSVKTPKASVEVGNDKPKAEKPNKEEPKQQKPVKASDEASTTVQQIAATTETDKPLQPEYRGSVVAELPKTGTGRLAVIGTIVTTLAIASMYAIQAFRRSL